MGIDIQVLINQVQPILLAIVAQNVLLFVCISQFHDFAPDQVAYTASQVDESKAVWGDPET